MNISKEQFEEMYNTMAMTDIAKKLGVGLSTVYETRRKMGIAKKNIRGKKADKEYSIFRLKKI